MSRNLRLYFDDILRSCEKILRYTQELDYDSFLVNDLRFDAVLKWKKLSIRSSNKENINYTWLSILISLFLPIY